MRETKTTNLVQKNLYYEISKSIPKNFYKRASQIKINSENTQVNRLSPLSSKSKQKLQN